MEDDGRITKGCVGSIMAVDTQDDYRQFWDDVSGEPLDREGVLEARKEELPHMHRHEVYREVPISQCIEHRGKPPIGTRWVDINKGDKVNLDYRSRLVAKEIKVDREDLFAATPPLEAEKLLMSMAVTESVGWRNRPPEL